MPRPSAPLPNPPPIPAPGPLRSPGSLPVKLAPPADPNRDYVSRSLLANLLTRGMAPLVDLIAKGVAKDALPQRTLTLAGVSRPASSPALDVFDRIVEGINNGTDLSAEFPRLARLIHAQEQRSEVIKQLLLTHDYGRLAKATRARDRLEETLFTQAMNDELLPAERVLLLEKLETIIGTANRRIGAESTSVHDIESLLEKIDYSTEAAGAGLRKKFQGTSAQGREVVRKLALKVARQVKAATDV